MITVPDVEVRRLYDAGASLHRLRRRFACSPGAVRAAILRAGGRVRTRAEARRRAWTRQARACAPFPDGPPAPACLHCGRRRALPPLWLCPPCAARPGVRQLYAARRRGWTPAWEAHLRRLAERAARRLPLFP